MSYLLDLDFVDDDLLFEDELDVFEDGLDFFYDDEELDNADIKSTQIRRSCSTNESSVKKHWSRARRYAARAVQRLDNLSSKPASYRKQLWNKKEKLWFGSYSSMHFNTVRRRMGRISRVLESPRLKIRCNPKRKGYGLSSPGIYIITLGKQWFNPRDEFLQARALIHEAAHIAGVVSAFEWKKYGFKNAKNLACQSRRKARNSADNYSFYTMIFSDFSLPTGYLNKCKL